MIRCIRLWTGDDQESHFEDGWIELAPGDGLRLHAWCNGFGKRVKGHQVVMAWWEAP